MSFVFGKENVERLDPNPGDLDFARAHGIGQYQNGSTLYEEANQYFKDLMANGLQDDATLELDLAWGLDGPTSNMYQNYEFSFYNVIELEEVKPLEPGEGNWEVSKSKTATQLDSDYKSKVTLSLPAADYEKSMDVVFVLDDTHAGSGIFAEAATTLLDELVSKKNLDIHVGIVSFDAAARDWLAATSDTYSGLVSLRDENAVEALKVAIGTELSSDGEGYQKRLGGTNTEWPLAMAQEMLSQGTGGEQHVIMFSDMYGYVYRGNLEVDGKTYENVPLSKINSGYELGQLCIAGPMYKSWEEVYNGQDEDKPEYDVFFRYRSGGSTASWDNYWTTFQGFDTAPTAPNKEDIVTTVWGETYFTPFEKSSCLTYDQVQELLANDVQVTIVNNNFDPGSAEIQTIKNQMLDALANQGVEVIREDTANGSEFTSDQMSQVFATLEDKLIQLVDAGSRVEDVIGYGTDNKGAEYNFDFVDDASALKLTVGEGEPYFVEPTTLDSATNETACYLFLESQTAENASFVLHYYENGKDGDPDECFVWDINVPVTKDMPVQLTYTVKLTNPSEVSGTHGQYDEKGHAQYESLKTNREAILYPVDSNGTAGRPEKFYTPTVSYEDDIPVIDEPDGGDEDPIRYTLTYVSNGGTEYDPERYNANTVVQIDKQPIREGYTFEGWYLDEELTEPVDEVKMTRNITVYAKWEPTSVPGDLNGDDHFAYIIGRDDGYIHPTDNINRAEVAAIFFRLLKEDVRQANLTDTHSFNDVDADMWYNTSVATMAKMGIVTGDPDGSFRPEDSITRAEFAAIAARFDEIAYDGEDLFSDIAGHWAQEEINAAANNGWILGYTDGTFGPQKYITRAEAMTLVNRVLNRLPEDTSDLLDDMIRWPDNQDTNIWYYLAVQEATNSHDYERKSDGVHEKWTALNENEDWVKYQ